MKKLIGTVILFMSICGYSDETRNNDITYLSVTSLNPIVCHSIEYTATNLFTDLRFPVSSINLVGAANPPDNIIISNSISAFAFDNTGNEELYFNAQMPHEYWSGTVLLPHMHVISGATPVTGIFSLEYSSAEAGGVFQSPVTLTITNTTSGVAGTHELWNFGNMNAFTNGQSGMVGCHVTRESGGTATDINVIEFDIHYRIQYGSGQEYP